MEKIYQVVVCGPSREKVFISLNTKEQTTVRQLKEKIYEKWPKYAELRQPAPVSIHPEKAAAMERTVSTAPDPPLPTPGPDQGTSAAQQRTTKEPVKNRGKDCLSLVFTDKSLDDNDKPLSEYGIQHMSLIYVVMSLPGGGDEPRPGQHGPTSSQGSKVSAPEEGDLGLRAEMSCGHAMTPESLTGWCRSLLDQCPSCEFYLEREDLTKLCVQCTVCTAEKTKVYEFCCQCLKPWKGTAPSADRCANEGCVNHDLELLKNCKLTDLPEVRGVIACPSIRACPTCGLRVEHDKTGCKNILCPCCQIEFCFVCLKLTPECLKTSSYFEKCSDGVAPRQTSIPVWYRN